MVTVYVCNALAMGMLDREVQGRGASHANTAGTPRTPRPISVERARELVRPQAGVAVQLVPAVGHVDTAAIIAVALGLCIEQVHARVTVRLPGGTETGVYALIGAYTGPRLPEGSVVLPAGATLEWWLV